MTGYLLEARNVARVYQVNSGFMRTPDELRAVDDVSLKLRAGEVLGIVGESGCGKSTLGRVLLGLTGASSGEVLLDGKPLSSLKRKELARRVQPIFQDPYSSLNPRKRVSDIVELPLKTHGIGTAAERRGKVAEIVERVGLGPRHLSAFPSQLSGGQRQRVAIARALVIQPELIICDEPTSALDVSVQSQILNLLQDLQRDFNLTYILISYNLAVVEHMANRVAVMYLGRIVEENDAKSLFEAPQHPYSRALLRSALPPVTGQPLPSPLTGTFPSALNPPGGCAFHPRCPAVFDPCSTSVPVESASPGGMVRCFLHDPRAAARG